jgi:hypothetical protein
MTPGLHRPLHYPSYNLMNFYHVFFFVLKGSNIYSIKHIISLSLYSDSVEYGLLELKRNIYQIKKVSDDKNKKENLALDIFHL